jgi:quinol monooxygenase YgiN
MFVRLVQFGIEPGHDSAAQALAADLTPAIAAQPGCQSVVVFGDAADGEYGLFVLWDTQEHADAAAGIIRPKLAEHLAGHITRPPNPRLFKVISA